MSEVAERAEPYVQEQPDPPRYLFTFAQVLGMVQAGVLAEKEPVELIEGELIEVAAENTPHSRYKRALTEVLYDRLDRIAYEIVVGSPLVLSPRNAPEPDIYVFARGLDDEALQGAQVDLAIEVSHTSLRFDLVRKARLYASFGLPEYWVVDVDRRKVWVHRDPGDQAYRQVQEVQASDWLSPLRLPTVSLRLGDLRLD